MRCSQWTVCTSHSTLGRNPSQTSGTAAEERGGWGTEERGEEEGRRGRNRRRGRKRRRGGEVEERI